MPKCSRRRAAILAVFNLLVVLTLAPNSRADDAGTKDKPFTNSLGMKYVPVPRTKVLMCIHETRRADYAAYAATNAAADPSWKTVVMENIPVGAGDDEPVVNVSWDDAKAFCEWLSKKEGRTYRLPLDREWSVAVGISKLEPASGATPESLSAKIKDVYPWGRQWPPAKGAGNYADEDCRKKIKSEKTMEGYADGFAVTAPVMSFPPNELGIYDLGGNVWEWCEDWYNDAKKLHIFRAGASWGSSAREPLLSSFRAAQTADRRWRCNGFRCVLVVEPETKVDEPKKPRKIAHRGCYYPFPVKAIEPKEPMARQFSLDRAIGYLDGMTRQWTQEAGCVSCHTTFPYLTARPVPKSVSGSAMDELREFMEYKVANWKSDRPLWDAEVLITATSLVVYDSNTTGKLQPRTRTALEKMWGLQRPDGAWNWLKASSPPFEHDDYYGAVLVAVGVGNAPKDYAASDSAKDGVAKLRQYFAKTPPPSLHHAAWLIWASAKLEGLMTKEQRDQKVKELVKLQKPDGGWSLPSLGGWKGHDGLPIDKAPSDGYATGLIVFALRQAGLPSDHDAIRKGVMWLKANQRESGSWFTLSLGTHYHLNFMSHSGTAFAVMALKACE